MSLKVRLKKLEESNPLPPAKVYTIEELRQKVACALECREAMESANCPDCLDCQSENRQVCVKRRGFMLDRIDQARECMEVIDRVD